MKLLKTALFSLCASIVVLASFSQAALAAFNPNRIIDDGIFNNTSSMSAGQIDAFLNQFPSSCISGNRGFTALDPTGYNPSSGYQYGGHTSAGNIIAHAAQAYDLNPQVLLTTLQKEQALVTGAQGCDHWRYVSALGYGCPDNNNRYDYSGLNLYAINGVVQTSVSQTCVNGASKAGFTQQLIRSAWLLKFAQQRSLGNTDWAIIRGSWNNSDDLQSCYSGPMTEGYRKTCPSGQTTYYDGLRSIDGTTVHMDNGGTAALYWFTPHFHGNQNFVTIFEGWFGSTVTPIYSWQELNQTVYTDSSKSTALGWNANLRTGQSAYVVLTVRNTGNQAWNRNSDNPVRLATYHPQDKNSVFCTNGWISCNRVAQPNEALVNPGETATFEFPVKAPSAGGGYSEYFNLVSEGKAWFTNPGVFIRFDVQPPTYSWSQVNQTVYTDQTKATALGWNADVLAGQKVYVKLTARNTGNTSWEKNGPNPIRLGTWNGQDRNSEFCSGSGWLSCNRITTQIEDSVAPGQNGTFEFWMQTPNRKANFREYFNLVAEGQTWMNPIGMFVGINANLPQYSWQELNQTVYTDSSKSTALGWNATLSTNQTAYVVMTVKNTGDVTWRKTANDPVIRLGTWFPQDRNSVFCSGWLSCNRIAGHIEATVPPGGTGTFEFPVKAPSTPGNYSEYFNMVAEGQTWMNPSGVFIKFTVQ